MFKKLFIALSCVLLAACSSVDTQTTAPASSSWDEHLEQVRKLQSWDISGKIGIITPDNSNSASLKWLQKQQSYLIDIHGPLGQGGASIQGSPNQVTVDISGEGEFSGPDPEYILYQQLGWDIPISDIYWWIRGIPAPDSEFQHTLEQNRLKTLQQNGWTIQYLRYNSLEPALPRKIRLVRNGLKITLVLHTWIAL